MPSASRSALPGPLSSCVRACAALVAIAVYFFGLGWMHPRTGDNLRYAMSLLSPRAFHDFLRAGLRGT